MPESLLTREEWEQLVERIDKQTLNPHERAQKVWILVQEKLGSVIDNWDIICFCSWYLSTMFPLLPDLEKYSKMLDVKVHQVHYQGDMWKDTNVIRPEHSSSKKGERISRDYSAE
jgi:hypothetical protein